MERDLNPTVLRILKVDMDPRAYDARAKTTPGGKPFRPDPPALVLAPNADGDPVLLALVEEEWRPVNVARSPARGVEARHERDRREHPPRDPRRAG